MSSPAIQDEKQLLLRIAAGDEPAFRQLYDAYRDRLYALGMYLTKNETLAEEIVQDVFLKVWEKRAELSQVMYFNAWLRTVARNTGINYLRSMATEKVALSRYEGQQTLTPEEELQDREIRGLLEAAIEQLPPQQKKVYLLSRREGKKQQEIAEALGISLYTAKDYMKLAQRSVRKYLESRLDVLVGLAITLFLE